MLRPGVGVGVSRSENTSNAISEAVQCARKALNERTPSLAIIYISVTFLKKIVASQMNLLTELEHCGITMEDSAVYASTPVGLGALFPDGDVQMEQWFHTDVEGCPPGDMISVCLVSWDALEAFPFVVNLKTKRKRSRKAGYSVVNGVENAQEVNWKHLTQFRGRKLCTENCIAETGSNSRRSASLEDSNFVLVHASASHAGNHLSVEGLKTVFPIASVVGGQQLASRVDPGVDICGLEPKAKMYAGDLVGTELGGIAFRMNPALAQVHNFVFADKEHGEEELENEIRKCKSEYELDAIRLRSEEEIEMRPVFAHLEMCAGRFPGGVMVRFHSPLTLGC